MAASAEAPLVTHDPILIDGDGGFTPANGVTSGSGTPEDPFVIEGWEISASGSPGITIRNTSAPFLVRDVRVNSPDRPFDGIVLANLANGGVEWVNVTNAGTGIYLKGVSSVWIRGANVSAGFFGISVVSASNVVLSENRFDTMWGSAFVLEDSRDILLKENEMADTDTSLFASSSSAISLISNRLQGTGRFVDSESVIARSNDVGGSLLFTRTRNATVEGNSFANGGLLLEGELRGDYSSHTMSGNVVNGRELRFVKGCAGVEVDGEPLGQLIIADCSDIRIANLTLNRTVAGVELAFVQDAVLEGNVVSDGPWGFLLYNVTFATVRNNTAWYQWSSPVVLRGSEDVLVYRNNFIQSNMPADAGGRRNAWNASYPNGGNYWAAYLGPDICGGVGQDVCGAGDGFGDVPHHPSDGVEDRYPRTEPFGMDDRHPVAVILSGRDRIPAGASLIFHADRSYDPQGMSLRAWWDFGDGHQEGGSSVFHQYMAPGTYTVTLKVTDPEFLSAIVSRTVVVTPPPVAGLSVSRSAVFVGESVTFDGSTSYSNATQIAAYEWNFGDGAVASGPVVEHSYLLPGTYDVLLVVYDADNVQGSATTHIRVFAPISLERHESLAGFEVDVPSGWPVYADVDVGGAVLEVVALGPEEGTIQTSLILDTDIDPEASETSSYLAGIVDGILDSIRRDDSKASLLEGPAYRSISGHGGVTFAVRYGLEPVAQKFAIVVSEEHGRYWLLLLTTTHSLYRIFDETFDSIVDGFKITLAPPLPPQAPPPLELVPYIHPSAGFRLPIPSGWTVQEDVALAGVTVELVVLGPVAGGTQTNVLVETDEDLTARETDSYLLAVANETISGIRQDNPSTSVDVMEGPALRTIGDHAAVTFELQYGTGQYFQKVVIVVSEPHRRFWILVLTTDGQSYPVMDEAFERMLSGFVITLSSPTTSSMAGILLASLLAGILIAVALIVTLVVVRDTRSRKPALAPRWPPVPMGAPPASPATRSVVPTQVCTSCGQPAPFEARFCGRCGAAFPPSLPPALQNIGPPPSV